MWKFTKAYGDLYILVADVTRELKSTKAQHPIKYMEKSSNFKFCTFYINCISLTANCFEKSNNS